MVAARAITKSKLAQKQQELVHMAQEIDRELRAIREAVRKPVESEFARGELTGPQRSIMQILVHSNGLSLKDLSRQIGLAHSTVSGIIDRLEKRGMVERHPDEADGRSTSISVSKEVRDYVRDVLPALAIHPLIEALHRAKPPEQAAILKGLRTLRRVLGAA